MKKANIVERLARREGFEPPTHALEGHCSIQLSYRRTRIFVQNAQKSEG